MEVSMRSVLSCSSQACKLKPKTTRREEICHFAASCNQSMLLILVLQTSTIQKKQRNIWSLLLCKVVPLGQLDNEHRCWTLADLQSHSCCCGQQCHGLHHSCKFADKMNTTVTTMSSLSDVPMVFPSLQPVQDSSLPSLALSGTTFVVFFSQPMMAFHL